MAKDIKVSTTIRDAADKLLSKMFLENPTKVFSPDDIYERLSELRKSIGVKATLTQSGSRRAVSECRLFLELHHHQSLFSYRSTGWRLATKMELSVLALRQVKKLIKSAQRSQNLLKISPPQYTPDALRTVFRRERILIGSLASDRNCFVEKLQNFQRGSLLQLPPSTRENGS